MSKDERVGEKIMTTAFETFCAEVWKKARKRKDANNTLTNEYYSNETFSLCSKNYPKEPPWYVIHLKKDNISIGIIKKVQTTIPNGKKWKQLTKEECFLSVMFCRGRVW